MSYFYRGNAIFREVARVFGGDARCFGWSKILVVSWQWLENFSQSLSNKSAIRPLFNESHQQSTQISGFWSEGSCQQIVLIKMICFVVFHCFCTSYKMASLCRPGIVLFVQAMLHSLAKYARLHKSAASSKTKSSQNWYAVWIEFTAYFVAVIVMLPDLYDVN